MNVIFDIAPLFARRANKKNEKLLELLMNEHERFALAKQSEMAGILFQRTMFLAIRNNVTTMLQHCVGRKSSLRIVSCNITLTRFDTTF